MRDSLELTHLTGAITSVGGRAEITGGQIKLQYEGSLTQVLMTVAPPVSIVSNRIGMIFFEGNTCTYRSNLTESDFRFDVTL